VATCIVVATFEFKILTQLDSRVHHCSDAEGDGADSKVKAAELCCFLFGSVARLCIWNREEELRISELFESF
jgi:hypothetical protein